MAHFPAIASAVSAAALACALGAAPAFAQDAGFGEGADAGHETRLLDAPSFAEAEPEIDFPACVGVARIEEGLVTEIPIPESQLWDDAFHLLGDAVGRTVAVLRTPSDDPVRAVADIRADASDLGLDFVVIYELAYDETHNPRAIDRLRVFPTFQGEDPNLDTRAAGAAILLDVSDGAMYGVASGVVSDDVMERHTAHAAAAGEQVSGSPRVEAFRAVTIEIAHEVETAFIGMMLKAGLPAPEANYEEGGDELLTEAQRIALADRAQAAAWGEAGDDPGC